MIKVDVRIRETKKGFLIEQKILKFLVLKTWQVIGTYRGLDDPYYFDSYEGAEEALITDLKFDIAKNSPALNIYSQPITTKNIYQ